MNMSKDKNLNKDIDLKDFNDGGVSIREMRFGLWLSQKRRFFSKLVVAGLILISAFFFIFSTYNYVIYFLAGDPNDQSWADTFVSSPRKITEDLIIEPPIIFSMAGRADLVVRIKNPNEKFLANFNYCFLASGGDLACGSDFILPGEEKLVTALGLTAAESLSGASFNLSEVYWRRIDARKISDWREFSLSRLNFEISDLDFVPGERSSLSEGVSLNTIKFSLTNKSAYGYYEAPFDILFFNGQVLQGVNRVQLNNFLPGEKRSVSLSWPGNLSGVTRTEIKPSINIMDDEVYLLYRGESAR